MIRKRQFSSQDASTDYSSAATSKYSQQQSQPSRIVDVSDLAQDMRREVRKYTQKCRQEGQDPIKLAGVLAVDAMPDSQYAEVYASTVAETLRDDGIHYEHVECRGTEPQDVEIAIEALNVRPDVHGILVYYPIFKTKLLQQSTDQRRYLNASTGVYFKSYDDYLQDVLRPEKDVEGLSHNYDSRYQFRARRQSHEIYVPCTALAVARILETYHIFPANNNHSDNDEAERISLAGNNNDNKNINQPWLGTTATVVNRSEVLGRPLAAMLAMKGATVYSVDEHSILQFKSNGKMRRCTEPHVTLDWCLGQSSLIVTGVPNEKFRLPLDSISAENATIVDVSEFANVNEEDVFKRPGITFVPSIGRVTVAALEHNLISLHQKFTQHQG